MPESCQEEDDKKVQVSADLALTITSQRNIDIFLKPGGQGDMPSSPEFLHGMGDIRIVEVL
jgi:hypothetical protein